MLRACAFALLGGLIVISGGLTGQEPKKDDPKVAKTDVKKDDAKKDDTKKDDVKKDETPTKLKGTLPANWKKIGLTEDQVKEIYKIQGKYEPDIEKMTAKIKELKATRDKEMREVLTPDQKKKLEEILIGKDK